MFTENDVFKALGLGAKVQAAAEPAPNVNIEPTGTDIGAKGQEVAEPAGQQPAAPASQNLPNTGSGEGNPSPMSEEQRRENAARRRREEQQAAVNAAVKAEREKTDAQIKDMLAGLGLKDPVSGKPISTMEELGEYQRQMSLKKLEADLAAGKLSKEGLDAAISNHPVVREAQQARQAQLEAQKQEQQQKFQEKVQAEIAEIQKMNPAIGSVEDLLNLPNAKEFYAAVQRVGNLADAYKLVHFNQLVNQQAEQVRQQAQVNARGKEHLTPTQSRGEGSVSVPADVMANYRRIMPNATEAQILAHYQKYAKK